MQSVSYMGDGSTTEFTFNFPYYENSNIIVTVNNSTASGYTIIGTSAGLDADIPYTGGKVVFDVAPTALDSIKISRDLPLTRVVDYQPTVQLNPTTLNQDMNYMMEVIKDVKDEFGDLSTKYAEIANKESTTTLLARIDEISDEISDVNETITDLNTDIENGRIMSKDAFYSYTTNCITEISQNINIVLTNGTLTVKAGTVYYVPNGTGVFTKQTLSADTTVVSGSANSKYFILIGPNGNTARFVSSSVYSGATAPTVSGSAIWYDTTNNEVKYTSDSGSTWTNGWSLPIAVCTPQSGSWVSIDDVFNGFGYIGSTVFVLPDITFIAPNGRNADGSLKTVKTTYTSVQTYTITDSLSGTRNIIGYQNGLTVAAAHYQKTPASGIITFDMENNLTYSSIDMTPLIDFGTVVFSSGKVVSITPKTTFHIPDYNDTEYIAHQAMPSDKYTALTLPTTGSAITAPADGYFVAKMQADNAAEYITLANSSTGLESRIWSAGSSEWCSVFIPCSKSDIITLDYSTPNSVSGSYLRFIYANGAK